MKKLVFLETPRPPRSSNIHDPAFLHGAHSMSSSLMRAAAKYSCNYRLFLVQSDRTDAEFYLEKEGLSDRYEAASCSEFLRNFSHERDVVIQCLGTEIGRAGYFRMSAKNPFWGVVGLTHDLFAKCVYEHLLLDCVQTVPSNDYIICSSPSAQHSLRAQIDHIEAKLGRHFYIHTPVIPHGVDAESICRVEKNKARDVLGISSDKTVFLYFGRLDIWQKSDLLGLINAYSEAFRNRNACLIIAGSAIDIENNPQVHEIAGMVHERVRDRSVEIHLLANLNCEEKSIVYSSADVFVSPVNSFQESFGLAPVEAMLYGLPIIATDWDGYRELIEPGQTGFLINASWVGSWSHIAALRAFSSEVESGKYVSQHVRIDWREFTRAMELLFSEHEYRIEMGNKGRVRAERNFTWDVVIERYSGIWKIINNEERNIEAIENHIFGFEEEVYRAIYKRL